MRRLTDREQEHGDPCEDCYRVARYATTEDSGRWLCSHHARKHREWDDGLASARYRENDGTLF